MRVLRWAVCGLLVLAAGSGARADTFTAVVRWAPATGSTVAGYRVYQRPLTGSYGVPIDAHLPAPAADGTLSVGIPGLDPATDWGFAVTAYASDGTESSFSNEMQLRHQTTNPCLTAVCDASGSCSFVPNSNDCADDGNPCTTDVCSAGACTHPAKSDGTSCSDGNVCNGVETCRAGACVGGTPLTCDDSNPCVTATCNPTLGCQFANNTNPCADDGDPCTTDVCGGGACTHVAGACVVTTTTTSTTTSSTTSTTIRPTTTTTSTSTTSTTTTTTTSTRPTTTTSTTTTTTTRPPTTTTTSTTRPTTTSTTTTRPPATTTTTTRPPTTTTTVTSSPRTTTTTTTIPGLPDPWKDADVGAVKVAGQAEWSDGAFLVSGAGRDIWDAADAFHFVYRPLAGDGQIVARVAALSATDSWAKAGIMMRESLAPGSRHAMIVETPGNGIAFQRRVTPDGPSTTTNGPTAPAPYWVALVRSGATIAAYTSPDGTAWTLVTTDTVPMAETIWVGVAVTSHKASQLCAAAVDAVAVSEGTALAAPWLESDIGAAPTLGATGGGDGSFAVDGGGRDIWDGADGFHFVYRPLAGDGQIVARVASQGATDPWAKAGVMIRETLDPGSRHAMIVTTPANGVAFQRRVTTGGATAYTPGPAASAPYWLSLVRKGVLVTAYASPDGVTWKPLGAATLPMTDTVYVGLAVSSHNTSHVSPVAFDGVTVAGATPVPAPWREEDVGDPSLGGGASFADDQWRVSGAGRDVWGAADAFHYVYQPLHGDGEIVAHVTDVDETDGWAKAGIMIRESLAPGARDVAAFVTPEHGIAYQARVGLNGPTAFSPGPAVQAPYWLALVRSGATVSGYASPDGSSWTLIGRTPVALATDVLVGLAVTSHDESLVCSGEFDAVAVSASADVP